MSAEQLDSGRLSDLPTPIRKEKKRVGWHAPSSSNAEEAGPDADADSSALSPAISPNRHRPVPPGAPDAVELSRALTKVLSDEEKGAKRGRSLHQHHHSETDVSPQGPISRPRPALKRNTSYDAPHEREEADRTEMLANERTIRSIHDARHRATQLARSLGSHSAPGSRRNSDEFDASFQSLAGDSDGLHLRRSTRRPTVVVDDYDEEDERPRGAVVSRAPPADAAGGVSSGAGGEPSGQHVRHRASHRRTQHEDEPLDEKDIGDRLVKSYTRKGRRDFLHYPNFRGRASGTSTPVIEQHYAQDYVPRPKKYRDGVLASLLKLYNDDRESSGGGGSGGSSGCTTPGTATPVLSPEPSPPASRSSSRARDSGSRRTNGLFSLNRAHRSTSSLTLTELMKSSSMFAAPGSSEISDRWADKLKREPPPSRSRREKHRVKKHIAAIIFRHRYIIKLCRALMMYGAPTHRLEEYINMTARVLEIEAQPLYIPSCMIISFDDNTTYTTEVRIVRAPQGVDLGRLKDVHNIYKDVVHDKFSVEEASRRLDNIMAQKPKFSVWFRVFLYGVASACVAPFGFQGRFIDLPFAFILGALVGVLQLVLAPSNQLYAHVFEVSAAMLTSFLARAFGSINRGNTFCFGALAQSSIALILPGYMVLSASLELQSYNIVSGSVRMVHAMIYTLFLGYGITIGASLYGMLDSHASSERNCKDKLGREWYFLFVPGFALCLSLVNQAKWSQTPVMILMALAGFCVNSYSSTFFHQNTEISNMLGALTIGILANLYSRLGRHVENKWLDVLEYWQFNIQPRLSRLFRKKKRQGENWSLPSDPESRPGTPADNEKPVRHPRQVGYSLAAAAMLPAIFVQVPSGLAIGGSLLAGVKTADKLTSPIKDDHDNGGIDASAFTILLQVVQVAIGISVGLFMSALIVYPLGKRRSGLFAF
ncbi:hypothetical protein ACO1O0_002843 [Amphichorda felina]